MSDFFPLRIKQKIHETSQCVSLEFEVPPELTSTFTFTPGQYLTLKTEIDGEEVRRSYSICSAPSDGTLRVAIKKVVGGQFSSFAMDHLNEGEVLDVMPPVGNFIQKEKQNGSQYCMIAAGSGITPILSLVKDILNNESNSQILLIYGNKSSDQIIFKEEIEGLKSKYLNQLSVFYIFSQEAQEAPLFNGRIDKDKFEVFTSVLFDPEEVREYFLCGPEKMIWSVKDVLEAKGIDEHRIRYELFTTSTPTAGSTYVGSLKEEEKKNTSAISIILDGQKTEFNLGYQDQSILDAALSKGLDLPFACKGGVCCTCKAKVLEGRVEMEVNYALEPDEIEAGMVLTCQSHPRTSSVIIDYDV